MTQIKALGWLILLGIVCRGSAGDELAVSSATPVETPPLIQTSTPQLYGGIGTSGTNAVFVWHKSELGADGTSKLLLTRVDYSGQPVQELPKFVVPTYYSSAYPELYPTEVGFFLRYLGQTNRNSPSRLMVTRIDMDGSPAFAPVVISTNNFKESDTASNGRSLLLLVQNYRSAGIKLDYTLVGWNGGIISTGVLDGASGGHSFAAASDGGQDFITVWSATAAPYLRVTRFSGTDGSLSVTGLGTNTMFVQAISHGKNGYLVAGGASLMLLSEDGTLVDKIVFTSVDTSSWQERVYPEGEGWILFTANSSRALRTYRITPTSAGLHVDDLPPYPAFAGAYSGTYAQPLVSSVAPFGIGRFLVLGNDGISVLTKSGLTSGAKVPIYADEMNSAIVASPFGYLVAWTEFRGDTSSIRGLRFAPDGSQLDDHSFEIHTFYLRGNSWPQALFDGKDYLVGWGSSLARISPQGATDIRVQSYSIDFPLYASDFRFVTHKGEIFASFSSGNISYPYLLVWKLGVDGQVGPEVDVHGFYLVSDGANLFSVGVNDKFQVFKIALDLGSANPEISTNILASSQSILISQLRHGFVLHWSPSQGNSSFAYFSNGQERLRGNALTDTAFAFVDTEDRLLMASFPLQGGGLSRFDSFNLETGERSIVEADLGSFTRLHVADSSADFLAVADSSNAGFYYVKKFWITTAKAPVFGASRAEEYRFTTTLNLNPKRRYRIETSNDLETWTFQQVVSGMPTFDAGIPWDSQGFIRAILVPE